jgi:hypothetical protein
MANSDKNILITPNTGSTTLNPTIRFTGANNTPVTLRTLDNGTVSFEGTAGQLFSISDGLSGTIFSVNDISGIPSIEVLDTGLVKINQYNGSTTIGNLVQNINTTAKTAAYTLALVDANKVIQMNGAFAFTVPLNSTVAYPIGTTIHLLALTTGVTVAFTSGITSYATPGLKLRAAGSMATLIKLNTDTWVLSGDLTA